LPAKYFQQIFFRELAPGRKANTLEIINGGVVKGRVTLLEWKKRRKPEKYTNISLREKFIFN
jgi:hypothetical protein